VTSLRAVQTRIRALGKHKPAKSDSRFQKTGPGQYAEGLIGIGLNAATMRELAREYQGLPRPVVKGLLRSAIHDERIIAALILVRQMACGDLTTRKQVFDLYLANIRCVDSWGLVDCSAPGVIGAYLADRNRSILDKLAKSKRLWERRIAIVATQWLIRQGEFDDTLRIAEQLLGDREDLIHKACGWMLRGVGKRDGVRLEAFLRKYLDRLPRTTLRYAIERFPEPLRKAYLSGELR
jgi:3-methyladenine DNA glycosylase AlkD